MPGSAQQRHVRWDLGISKVLLHYKKILEYDVLHAQTIKYVACYPSQDNYGKMSMTSQFNLDMTMLSPEEQVR